MALILLMSKVSKRKSKNLSTPHGEIEAERNLERHSGNKCHSPCGLVTSPDCLRSQFPRLQKCLGGEGSILERMISEFLSSFERPFCETRPLKDLYGKKESTAILLQSERESSWALHNRTSSPSTEDSADFPRDPGFGVPVCWHRVSSLRHSDQSKQILLSSFPITLIIEKISHCN